jgi:hypothetical protein
MDDGVSWLVILAVGIGIFVYYLIRRQNRASQSSQSRIQFQTTVNHFNDLLAKNTQIKLIAGDSPNVELRNGEEVLCVFPETTLGEPRAVREWQSVYGGPSIRIAKGFSLRFGQSRGHAKAMRSYALSMLAL